MNIKIFMSSAAEFYEQDLLRSFGQGIEPWLQANNTDRRADRRFICSGKWQKLYGNAPQNSLDYEYTEAYRPCDMAVIFGSWKPREKGSHQTRMSVASAAQRFIVIETPLLKRVTNELNQYWRVGINGYLNNDAAWPMLTVTEAETRLVELGIEWAGWKNRTNGHIVLVLQLPGDASLRGTDINEWAYQTVRSIRERTDKNIVIRSHPLVSERAFELHAQLGFRLMQDGIQNIRFSDGAVTPWSEDITGAYCTVTFSSGMAVDSILAGIPTVACDPGNFAWGISSNHVDDIKSIRRPDTTDIRHWLKQLAACQWTAAEMRSGRVWEYLMRTFDKMQATT